MSSLVKPTLRDILTLIRLEREDEQLRQHIIEDVRDAVRTMESVRGIKKHLQGRFVKLLVIICSYPHNIKNLLTVKKCGGYV